MEAVILVIAGIVAYAIGAWAGYREGYAQGREDQVVRERLASLPRPWR